MRKKMMIASICMMAVISLSACKKNPESSIVKNKDLDNMIEQAKSEENGSIDTSKLAGKLEDYKTTFKDESLHVSVEVDAKVELPKHSQMSIFRVRQKKIEQSFLDQVKNELIKSDALYDGSALSQNTKKTIEQEIQGLKNEIKLIESDSESNAKDKQTMKNEYQQQINELQTAYENAPDDIQWSRYPADGRLKNVKEMYKKDANNDFYAWQYELNPKGEVYYEVSDGSSGQYTAMYAQNNDNYGNCLRYSRDRHNYIRVKSVVANSSCNNGAFKLEEGIKKNDLIIEMEPDQITEYTDVAANMTLEQAASEANQLLNSLGLTDFQYYDGGLYGEALEPDSQGKIGYRKVYILKYLRSIDEIFVNNESRGKHSEGWQGENYVKQEWEGESIVVTINDDGIVGFYYNTPIEILETVVEQSNLKPFSEIRDIFEQMSLITNAKNEKDENVSIKIDQVILRYTRISEPDSFETGLLVPVWDFIGTLTHTCGDFNDVKEGCIMTVNAIDGSIIDRELGY